MRTAAWIMVLLSVMALCFLLIADPEFEAKRILYFEDSASIASEPSTSPKAALESASFLAKSPKETEAESTMAATTGVFELNFTTTGAAPVKGVSVEVLTAKGLRIGKEGISDAEGKIRLRLAPGYYCWTKQSRHSFDLVPPSPPQFKARPNGWQQNPEYVSRTLSGLFEIRPGEIWSASILVHTGGSISGYLPKEIDYGAIAGMNEVRAFERKKFEHPDELANSLITLNQIDQVTADEKNRFIISGLGPGDYLLNARWSTGTDLYFAVCHVELNLEQEIELGTLQVLEGPSISCAVRLMKDGKEIDCDEPTHYSAHIQLENESDVGFGSDYDFIAEGQVGKEVTFHGLPQGTWSFHIIDGPRWLKNTHVKSPGRIKFTIPGPPVYFDYVVEEAPKAQAIELIMDSKLPKAHVDVWIRSRDGKLSDHLVEKRNFIDGKATFEVSLPPGPYEILAHTGRTFESDPNGAPNLVAFVPIEISEHSTSTIAVHLTTASFVKGLAVGNDGLPVPHKPLGFGLSMWKESEPIYFPITDQKGRFVLGGLHPTLQLQSSISSFRLTPNSGQSEFQVPVR